MGSSGGGVDLDLFGGSSIESNNTLSLALKEKKGPASHPNLTRAGMGRPVSSPNTPLNHMQECFVREYLVDLNSRQAAIRAGYSEKSAAGIGSNLLSQPHVRAAIEAQYQKIYSTLDTKARRVIAELISLGFSDVRDLFNDNGELIDIKSLPDSIAPAVSSVEVVRKTGRNGDEEVVKKVKLWSKTQALNMLGQHLGILKNIVEHTGPGGGPIQVVHATLDPEALSPEVRQELLKQVQAQMKQVGSGVTEAAAKEQAQGLENEDGGTLEADNESQDSLEHEDE